MSVVIPYVATAISAVFTGISAAAALTVAKALVYTVAMLALSKISKALAPKISRPRPKADVEYSGTQEPRRILYGQNMVSGMNVIPPIVTGANGEYLHQVLAIAGTEITGIDSVYFDTTEIPNASIGAGGDVNAGTYSGKASIRKYLGTTPQAADDILMSAFTQWNASHRGDGVAYLALRYTFDQSVYKNAKPDVKMLVRGRSVYDPRLDTTPGANPTNVTYFAYTTNPALCLADYLTLDIALGDVPAKIDWPLVVTAANECDETVSLPSAATQNRYTCNTVLYAPMSPEDFNDGIETLAKAMMGACYFSGGKWRMYAGSYSTSEFTLTESDVGGQLSVLTAQSRKSGGFYNAVRGHFIDAARNYQDLDFTPITSSAFQTEDGGERIFLDADFPCVQNQYEAQRNAILLLRQSRRRRIVKGVFTLRNAFGIRPYMTGTVTIAEVGWTNQLVRCIGWRLRPEPAIELDLQELGSADFDDPLTTDYTVPGSIVLPTPADYKPGAVSNFAAQGLVDAILFKWDPPTNAPIGVLYQLFEYTSASPFSSATQVSPDTPQTQITLKKNDTVQRYYWIRTRIPSTGQTGTVSLSESSGMPAKALAVTAALSGSMSPGSVSSSAIGASQTTGTATVTPTGGTAPYTYAWTWDSGGTGLTITSATAAATTFGATGLAVAETRTGIARCTITDTAAATYAVTCSVSITRVSGISLNSKTVQQVVTDPANALASYTLANTRAVQVSPGSTSDEWAVSGITASDYEARATVVSGSVSGGTTGSWLGLGTSRTWERNRTTIGTSEVVLTIEIRDVATSTVRATASITLRGIVSSTA